MPLFIDVELEFTLDRLHPDDIQLFMHWYYSLGKFIRYALTYYLYNNDSIEKEKAEYLSTINDFERMWFDKYYADEIPLVQTVFIRLMTEVNRRKNNHLLSSDKAIEGIYTAVEKLAKQAHITPKQFFEENIYPLVANIRNKRIKQFYRFYTGKNLIK